MSKYIKLEDLKWHSPDESIAKPLIEFYITESDIAELPTIEVSKDCISREWVKGICEAMLDEEMLGHMLGYIEDAPSVVPSRAEGEWIDTGIGKDEVYDEMYVCSKCGSVEFYSNFCPNCGARMKGADNE